MRQTSPQSSPVVLITGSSSGIGRALCQEYWRRGYRVVATARQLESLADLQAQGMAVWPLDVTQPQQLQTTVAAILATEGRVDVLINNAGFGQFGPLLELTPTQLQDQFQTNTFAPLYLVQQVAAAMARQGGGVVVNMGSIAGVTTTPLGGAYCASKAALHTLSDALRMELAPFGITVVTVQPGAIRSSFGDAALKNLVPIAADSWYAPIAERVQERANISQQGATPVETFAAQLVTILERPRPPAIIRLGKKSGWLPLLGWLPPVLRDRLFSRRFGLNTLGIKG